MPFRDTMLDEDFGFAELRDRIAFLTDLLCHVTIDLRDLLGDEDFKHFVYGVNLRLIEHGDYLDHYSSWIATMDKNRVWNEFEGFIHNLSDSDKKILIQLLKEKSL